MAVSFTVYIDYNRNGSFADSGDAVVPLRLEFFLGMAKAFDSVPADSWAEMVFDNRTGAFSPESSGVNLVGLPIIIQGDGQTLWTGFIEWVKPQAGIVDPVVVVRCHGRERELRASKVRLPLQLNGQADVMIGLILDRCRFQYARLSPYLVLDDPVYGILDSNKLFGAPVTFTAEAGLANFPYVGDTWRDGVGAYDAVRQIVDVEQGRFYFDRNAEPVFINRDSLLYFPNIVPFQTAEAEAYGFGEGLVTQVRLRYVPRSVGSAGSVLWDTSQVFKVEAGDTREIVCRFRDVDKRPIGATDVIDLVAATDWTANRLQDGTGADVTSSMLVEFSTADDGSSATVRFSNSLAYEVYIHGLQVRGTPLNQDDPVTIERLAGLDATFYGLSTLEVDYPLVADYEEARGISGFLLGTRHYPRGFMHWMEIQNPSFAYRTLFVAFSVNDAALGHHRTYFVNSYHYTVDPVSVRVRFGLEPAIAESVFFHLDTSVLDGPDILYF